MNSRIGSLYPSTKAMILFLIIVISVFTPGYIVQYLFFPVFLLISVLAGTGGAFLKKTVRALLMITGFIFLFQVFIVVREDQIPLWGFLHFSRTGLDTALELTSRIAAVSSGVICFLLITKMKDIIYAMEKQGLPRKAVFLIAATIQILPQMKELQNTIMDAQRSRGIETEGNLIVRAKALIPVLSPLMLSSIQQTEDRVLALEARAFSAGCKKTSIYIPQKHAVDVFLQVLCVILFVGYVVWRVFLCR